MILTLGESRESPLLIPLNFWVRVFLKLGHHGRMPPSTVYEGLGGPSGKESCALGSSPHFPSLLQPRANSKSVIVSTAI